MADDIKMIGNSDSFIGSLKKLSAMHPDCRDEVTLSWLSKAENESAVSRPDFDLEAVEYLAQKLQQNYPLPTESLQAVVVDMIYEKISDDLYFSKPTNGNLASDAKNQQEVNAAAIKALLGLAMFTVLKDTDNNIDLAQDFLNPRINHDVKLYQELQQKIADLAKRNCQPTADVENPQLGAISRSSAPNITR